MSMIPWPQITAIEYVRETVIEPQNVNDPIAFIGEE